MNQVVAQVISGLIVAGVVAVASFFLGRRYFATYSPLPAAPTPAPKDAYRFLKGTWVGYHLTSDEWINEGRPYWLRHKWQLSVARGGKISGAFELPRSGEGSRYKLIGEVRVGRMVITGTNVQDPQDFFTAVFPNLLAARGEHPIVGSICAFDWNNQYFVGPIILAAQEASLDQLNMALSIAAPRDLLAQREVDHMEPVISSAE